MDKGGFAGKWRNAQIRIFFILYCQEALWGKLKEQGSTSSYHYLILLFINVMRNSRKGKRTASGKWMNNGTNFSPISRCCDRFSAYAYDSRKMITRIDTVTTCGLTFAMLDFARFIPAKVKMAILK